MYANRYPSVPDKRWQVIENAYDEEEFCAAEQAVCIGASSNGPTLLLHSGLLYPSERDPRAFFSALQYLLDSRKISPQNLRIILRASGYEDHYRRLLREHRLHIYCLPRTRSFIP
jgi:hypothetical protein